MTATEVLAILRTIWPEAGDGDVPAPVVNEFVRRVIRSGLGTDGFQAACVAHRLEDRYAAKSPDYAALTRRISSKVEAVRERKQYTAPTTDPAEAAAIARQQKADAALRRVIDGMDDGELRALIAEGVAKAPHLAGVGGLLSGRLEASRAAMKGTLTPGVVMAHQHLRMLAKHAVGLVEVVGMAGQPAGGAVT